MSLTSAPPNSNRWILLITVAAGLLLVTLDNSVLYTALPTLTRELGATASQSLWIINAYPLVMAGLLLGTGTLGDRIGHRAMFLGGLVLFGLASLVAAFSPSAEWLIGARAFLAVGASAMMPATLALLRVTFEDERERNLAIAIWGCIAIVGAAIGPILGGFLLEHFWWGSVFLINVPLVVAAFVAAWVVAPRTRTDLSRPWDLVSSILALVTLSGLVVAIKYTAKAPPVWQVAAPSLLVALLGGALFARRQTRLPYPLLDFSIFRNAAFLAGVVAAVVAMFTIAGVQLVTTQRFQLVSGSSPLEAGLVVSAIALGCLPTTILGGAFLHRIGLRYLIAGGLFLGTAGVGITTAGLHLGFGWMVAGLLVTGGGLGAAISVASTAIIGNAPAERAGMAASVEEVSYEFGSLFAVALLGSLLTAIFSASIQLPPGVPESARENVVAAMALAGRGGGNPVLLEAATAAFDHGYVIIMSVIAGVLLIGSGFCFWILRSHGPGSKSSVFDSH